MEPNSSMLMPWPVRTSRTPRDRPPCAISNASLIASARSFAEQRFRNFAHSSTTTCRYPRLARTGSKWAMPSRSRPLSSVHWIADRSRSRWCRIRTAARSIRMMFRGSGANHRTCGDRFQVGSELPPLPSPRNVANRLRSTPSEPTNRGCDVSISIVSRNADLPRPIAPAISQFTAPDPGSKQRTCAASSSMYRPDWYSPVVMSRVGPGHDTEEWSGFARVTVSRALDRFRSDVQPISTSHLSVAENAACTFRATCRAVDVVWRPPGARTITASHRDASPPSSPSVAISCTSVRYAPGSSPPSRETCSAHSSSTHERAK
ncbi:hypothetical protein WBK50_33340 [Pseudonocardia sp. T1-2H]|uniref:hypothetical protein n=1 Tax=Pseudonocardia sp. T1-2H TaxID=3128899 RepID=UPI0031019A07